jgi:hypothetical protein
MCLLREQVSWKCSFFIFSAISDGLCCIYLLVMFICPICSLGSHVFLHNIGLLKYFRIIFKSVAGLLVVIHCWVC